MQQISCTMLFRWFLGLCRDAPVWDGARSPRIATACWTATSCLACSAPSWRTERVGWMFTLAAAVLDRSYSRHCRDTS